MKRFFKAGLLAAMAVLVLSSCNCYNKMTKKLATVQATSTPSVLSLTGKDVKADIVVSFPAKYFNKKATLRLTPVIEYVGGELAAAPFYVQGTKVKDNYTVISNTGGTARTSVSFPYKAEMKRSVLVVRIDAKCKNGEYEAIGNVFVADGVSTVQEFVNVAGKPAWSQDNFQRHTTISQEARIMFLINRSEVRSSQLNSEDVKALENFIVENTGVEKKTVGSVYTKSYASPDGPVKFNDKLSQDRARQTESAMKKKYSKIKPEFDVEALGEDWEGFKELVQASDIPDKNLILQVLQMYGDSEKRDAEIKNMTTAFNVLKEKVLPELRRSKLHVDVDVEGLSDQELRTAVANNISSLDVEEMLFAATLYDDNAQKASIYKAAADKYNDYRAWNNYGIVMLIDGKTSEASSAFATAARLNSSSNEVINNLGLAAIAQGNYAEAKRYLSSINTEESKYNNGLLNIYEGKYSDAVKSLDGYNLAVAEILNGNLSKAKSLLANEKCACTDYLKGVIAAREGDATGVVTNLKSAFAKDPSLKAEAKKDVEFAKYIDSDAFKALL